MRSSFRDWGAECSDAPREIAEFALGHVEGSAAELAYRRTDYFERRRELMQAWADYLARPYGWAGRKRGPVGWKMTDVEAWLEQRRAT